MRYSVVKLLKEIVEKSRSQQSVVTTFSFVD